MAISLKQQNYLGRAHARVNIAEGSIRSGKTHISLMRWFTFLAVDAPSKGALVMVGQSRDSLYRNIFEPVENDPTMAAFAPFIHYRQGAPTARILGRLVHVVGAADAKAEPRIRGMTVGGAYVDELSTLPEAFFKQLLGRMSVKGAQMFATTNPDAPRHWLKVEYLDRLDDLPDWRHWHFTLDDNPSLEPSYVAALKREFRGLWYRRFILGLWVAAEGAVFEMWDEEHHVAPASSFPTMDQVLAVGVDYGDTHDTRGYLLGMGPDTRVGHEGESRLYVLDEWAPGKATQAQQSRSLQLWLAGQPQGWRNPGWIAVDSAAASFRNQLSHDGVPGVRNAHKKVLSGIRLLASLLAVGKLVVSDSCTQLIDHLPGYTWDAKATVKGQDAPVKQDDDEVDALRYAVHTTHLEWASFIPLAAAQVDAQDSEEAQSAAA